MILQQQIPRNALAWIMLSLSALLVPHIPRLPVWVVVVFLIAAIWRIQIFVGRWSYPGWQLKLTLMLSSFAGIYLSYQSLLGLEPMVALLLTAAALKLLELVRRKDAYVLLFLGYFICVTEFLFSQGLPVVLYSCFSITLVTTALVALHQPAVQTFRLATAGKSGVMLLQAVPLMLVLFFLFPRIGPLWTVPIKSNSAKTGVSDHLQPGDISRLSQSDAVAFRVRFDGDIPPSSQLYWRGLVFSRLQGGAWTSLRYFDMPPGERRPATVPTHGNGVHYSIIIEPTQQNWLYSLRYARPESPSVVASADFRLYSPVVVEDQLLYRVRSWPDAVLDTPLSAWRRHTELALPTGENQRSRRLAQELRQSSASDEIFVRAVLDHFRNAGFVYTLQPPLLPRRDTVDAFLFQSRRGFCEHYASAFVWMMRAAGVPARVVAGYQGGEVNPVNRTVIVHQFDAHAWAEVWLSGRGWVRVDPTAAVSPDRVELGLEQAMAGEGSFLSNSPLSPLRYRNVVWLNLLRLRYDALTYRWQSWVVGFDSNRQAQLLRDVFGQMNARTFAVIFLVSWVLVLVPVAASLLRRRDIKPLGRLDRAYWRFCERLARAGMPRSVGEPPSAYARRLVAYKSAWRGDVDDITDLYTQLSYAPLSPRQYVGLQRKFLARVRRFRPGRERN